MSMVAAAVAAVERAPLPDRVTRAGIALLVNRTAHRLRRADAGAEARFAADMAGWPIAVHVADANAQHYELPAEFFALALGPRRKYSCCLYDGATSLAAAEDRALEETAEHAQLADGQRILELGCGWGSLTLWMAEHYPHAEIVAVSNSHGQRAHIEAELVRRGLRNVTVVTADMNSFAPVGRFDRVVSVEMFEHMANWQALLARVHAWLVPDGRVFVHVFSHNAAPYRFDHTDKADWIATHFFTGGIMPSHGLIRQVAHRFEVEADWRWSGIHYERTANDWLENFDRHTKQIEAILTQVYGADAMLWKRRWRLFFLATAGLFGARGGSAWGISHYRLRPV
jgi:cyclopropane-fatty-acyl-phospholipid synthase